MCESMLKAYAGSVEFLVEHRKALGADSPSVGIAQHTEVLHLQKFFRSATPTREDVTVLLKAMREDGRDAFTSPQKKQLM